MLLSMKRTTFILDDAILRAVRQLAEREGSHMSDVVNALLAEALRQRKRRETDAGSELPTYSMGRPRVNLGDRNALEALMHS